MGKMQGWPVTTALAERHPKESGARLDTRSEEALEPKFQAEETEKVGKKPASMRTEAEAPTEGRRRKARG